MNPREADIARKLTEWLDRYSCPKHLAEKPEAAQKEAECIAKVLCKMAPATDYGAFLNRVFDTLDFQMKTRAWPTVGEVGAVCANVRKETAATFVNPEKPKTPAQIVAAKMDRGEPVGEGWLYGLDAVEMIRDGLVSRELMETYRSGAFLARRSIYGEAQALAWEADAKARHRAADEVWRGRNGPRGFAGNLPDKSVVVAEQF